MTEESRDEKTEWQSWYCEKCDRHGDIMYAPAQDVRSVIYDIEDSHRKVSPQCDQPVARIRVRNMTKREGAGKKGGDASG